MNEAESVFVYTRQALQDGLVRTLTESVRPGRDPIEIVVEGLGDVSHLRGMHAAGFLLFYGYGLPEKTMLFLGKHRGFMVDGTADGAEPTLAPLKHAEDLYFRLLWRRFGNAVVVSGKITERVSANGILTVVSGDGREHLCRQPSGGGVDCSVGTEIEIFGWQKWGSRILHALRITVGGI